jgi:hypothetical protein
VIHELLIASSIAVLIHRQLKVEKLSPSVEMIESSPHVANVGGALGIEPCINGVGEGHGWWSEVGIEVA